MVRTKAAECSEQRCYLFSSFWSLLCRCLASRRKKKIVPNLAKHFLLPVGKNNAESSPWRKSVFHTHTHLRVKWDRLKTRGLGHEKHKYDFLERSLTVACSQFSGSFRTGLIHLPAELWAAQSKKQRHCRRPQRKEAQLKQWLDT